MLVGIVFLLFRNPMTFGPRADDIEAKQQEGSKDEWTDAAKPFQQGGVQVQVTRMVIDKVTLESSGSEAGESQDRLCQISLRITTSIRHGRSTIGAGRAIPFSSDAKLTDDIGNRYKGH